MAAMFGWLRLARICASRVNRARRSGSLREGVGEDLQGDLAVELGVGGLPDLAHAALAEEGGDVVVGYALQSHWSQARNCWADRTIGGTCLESEEHPRPEADLHTGATRKPAS